MRINYNSDNTLQVTDGAAMPFMTLVVQELDETLTSAGVADAAMRKRICEKFLFHFAYRLDAGWLVSGDRKLFPVVCFAERPDMTKEDPLGPIETLHVPTADTSWHEYAHGIVEQYFDGSETGASFRHGSYDIED